MKQTINRGTTSSEEARRKALAIHWLEIYKRSANSAFKTVKESSLNNIEEIYRNYPELKESEE